MAKAKRARITHRKKPRRTDGLLIRQLREEVLFLRKQFKFLQGKCERLELSLMESKAGPPAAYVERTEAIRPPIGSVEAGPGKLHFATIREEWGKLSAEEQEAHLENGDWKIEGEQNARSKHN